MLSFTQTGWCKYLVSTLQGLIGHLASLYFQSWTANSSITLDDEKGFKFSLFSVWECLCMFVLAPFARFPISSPGHSGLSVTQRSAVWAANTQKQTPRKWRLTLQQLPNCPLKVWLTNEIMEQVGVFGKKREWDFKRRLFEDGNGWRSWVRPPPPPLRPQRQLARQLIGGRSDRAGKTAKMGQKVPIDVTKYFKKYPKKNLKSTEMGLKVAV